MKKDEYIIIMATICLIVLVAVACFVGLTTSKIQETNHNITSVAGGPSKINVGDTVYMETIGLTGVVVRAYFSDGVAYINMVVKGQPTLEWIPDKVVKKIDPIN